MGDRQLQLVIIDTDYDYLKTIEEDLIRKFSSAVHVQVITDPGYVDAFFSEKQRIDLLLVDEDSYGDYLQEHDIGQTFLMVKEVQVGRTYPENVHVLLKYMPKEEILEKMDAALFRTAENSGKPAENRKRKTKIVAVYSPIGGCGKSLTCLAIAKKLKMLDQKVLLVSCDQTQSLSAFLPEEPTASESLVRKLKEPDEDTYWTILQNIGQDTVSYVLPFDKALTTLGVETKDLHVLVDTLAQKNDFDVIILDVGTTLDRYVTEFLSGVNSLILLTEVNEIAGRKMQKLLKDPDLLPKCDCILVANEYRSDGTRIARDTIFGAIAPYQTWQEALEDPVYYRIALKIAE